MYFVTRGEVEDLRTEVGRLEFLFLQIIQISIFFFVNSACTILLIIYLGLSKIASRWSLENAASLVFDRRLNWEETWGKMMVRHPIRVIT